MKFVSIAIYVYAGNITIEYVIRYKTSLWNKVLSARNKGDSLFEDWDMQIPVTYNF